MKRLSWLLALCTITCFLAHGAERVIQGIVPRISAAAAATKAIQPANPAPSVITDVLEFANGDVLRGTFLAIDPELGVRWRHDAIREPIAVIPAKIRNIRLQQNPRPDGAKNANCKLILANGDSLAGMLTGLDSQSLTMETWYAGSLTIPRSALRMLMVTLARGEILYQGPTGMDGWTATAGNRGVVFDGAFAGNVMIQGAVEEAAGGRRADDAGGWTYKDEAFHAGASGCLGRDLNLPPASNIEFDLECATYPQVAIHFYTDAVDKSYGHNAYVLQFSSRMVYLRRSTRPGSTRSLGTVESPIGMGGKAKGHVSIRTDTQKQSVALYIDEVLVKKWTDTAGAVGNLGTGLMFFQQGSNPAKISNIRITRWDGRLDDPTSSTADLKDDLLVLSNQDKISGQLATIKTNTLDFKTSFSQLQIPLDRVSYLQFAGGKADPSPSGAARLSFRDYGRLTLKVERWSEQSVDGESPIFGKTKLNPSAFNAIYFTFQP